jgi:hypothetical protein
MGPGGAGAAGLAVLIVACLALPGIARRYSRAVVPSTAAILSVIEVPG